MFVKTTRGAYYPISSIECLAEEPDPSGALKEVARLKDGKSEELAPGEIRRVTEASGRPFPAAPDTFVLQEVVDDNDRLSLDRVPVLGWVVTPTRGVVPITIEGINHGSDQTVPVVMPSGEVVVAMECSYISEDCYFAELKSSKVS
ncbi:MAG TPA: hypothetical protein VHE36_08845 [Sphingomicrobium sp.]|jgi:hypothetical protein|nr:hypothetical protein [Sphingomicrobium sp.]